MTAVGFTRGHASPCTFYHKGKGIRTYIHGDDYVSVGSDSALKWLKEELEKKYEIKTEVLGPDKTDSQQVKVLNRIITWTSDGVQYEADPRHVELILQQLNISECKPVTTPGTKEEGRAKP